MALGLHAVYVTQSIEMMLFLKCPCQFHMHKAGVENEGETESPRKTTTHGHS